MVKATRVLYGKNLKILGLSDFMMDIIWDAILPEGHRASNPDILFTNSEDILTICDRFIRDYQKDINKGIETGDIEMVQMLVNQLPDIFQAATAVKNSPYTTWYIEGNP